MLEVVKPYLKNSDKGEGATIVVGCAQGDLHDIGLNLAATQLAVGGFNVINLGIDVSVAKFISTAKENDASIIGYLHFDNVCILPGRWFKKLEKMDFGISIR